VRTTLADRGTVATIRPLPQRKVEPKRSRESYARRHLVENLFADLKQFRGSRRATASSPHATRRWCAWRRGSWRHGPDGCDDVGCSTPRTGNSEYSGGVALGAAARVAGEPLDLPPLGSIPSTSTSTVPIPARSCNFDRWVSGWSTRPLAERRAGVRGAIPRRHGQPSAFE